VNTITTELFSPKVDYVLKKIFGSESHLQVLISFLNGCFENNIVIESVQIQYTEMTKELVENSFSRLDILATTNHGEVINIEMQRADEKNMVKRSLYYCSKVFVAAYYGKNQYQALPRTICINILDFDLLTKERSYHNVYNLQHNKNHHPLTYTMELHFIELPKLTDNDKGLLSRWTAFIDDPNSGNAKTPFQIKVTHYKLQKKREKRKASLKLNLRGSLKVKLKWCDDDLRKTTQSTSLPI